MGFFSLFATPSASFHPFSALLFDLLFPSPPCCYSSYSLIFSISRVSMSVSLHVLPPVSLSLSFTLSISVYTGIKINILKAVYRLYLHSTVLYPMRVLHAYITSSSWRNVLFIIYCGEISIRLNWVESLWINLNQTCRASVGTLEGRAALKGWSIEHIHTPNITT